MSVARLPHVSTPNNSVNQTRRRYNEAVDQITNVIGSTTDNTGQLGALQTQVTTNTNNITTIQNTLAPGINGTAVLAKLTGGGTNGSLTFVKGIITAYVAPT